MELDTKSQQDTDAQPVGNSDSETDAPNSAEPKKSDSAEPFEVSDASTTFDPGEPFEDSVSESSKPLAQKMLPALGAIVSLLVIRWVLRRRRAK